MLLGQAVSCRAQVFDLLLDGTVFLIERDGFVHQREPRVLEFIPNVLSDGLRIFPEELDV